MTNEGSSRDPGEAAIGGYKLAYDEVVRALSEQQSTFDSIRSRTGIVLSAAAISTSFLGAQALQASGWTVWSALAVLLFFGVGASALAIIWPLSRSEGLEGFAVDPARLIGTYIETEEPLSLPLIHRDLALHMRGAYDDNERDLDLRVRLLQLCCSLLVGEIALWVVGLAE